MNKIHDIYQKSDFDMFDSYRQDKEKIERERQTELLRLQMELKNATSLVQAYMRENDALKASQVPECVLDALRYYTRCSFLDGRFPSCMDRGLERQVSENPLPKEKGSEMFDFDHFNAGLRWLADHPPKGGA
ncbi:MAG: hypothetical protein GY765_13565 [bacterium]|nr:hypothetical protein [bacterium]